MEAWRYPKSADAYLADDLTPYMRGKPYPAASSGGRTLIALAWQLALFEIAWERKRSLRAALRAKANVEPRFAAAAAKLDRYAEWARHTP